MARYGQPFKDKAVSRLLPPESAEVETFARELSISAATLQRWRAETLSHPPLRERDVIEVVGQAVVLVYTGCASASTLSRTF